ncbi:MAG: glycosyltransferase family 2 protein [bacterium]
MNNHIENLPPPPPHKTGWPWTVESEKLLESDSSQAYPKISIITPSYNQGEFLEETIRSVLLQNYPNREYIIMDGGSTDNTVDIIKKYEQQITFWVSEKDNGQSHAINKGFERSTGEMGMWLCSDDILCENALNNFVEHHFKGADKIYIGKGYQIDINSNITKEIPLSKIDTIEKLLDITSYWRSKKKRDSILQQSVLYPIEIFRKVGGLSINYYYTMDYELWCKLFIYGLKVVRCNTDIGMFRWYKGQKTSFEYKATKELVAVAKKLLKVSPIDETEKQKIKYNINKYWLLFRYSQFRSWLGVMRRIKRIFN